MKRSLWVPVDSTLQKRYFSGRPNLVQGWALRSPLWRARTTVFLLPLFFFFLPLLSMLTAATSATNTSLKNSFLSSSLFNQCSVAQKSWGLGLYSGMPFPLHWKIGAQSGRQVQTETSSQPLKHNRLLVFWKLKEACYCHRWSCSSFSRLMMRFSSMSSHLGKSLGSAWGILYPI